VVILVFIFLTPKSWFSGGERVENMVHPSPVAKTLLLSAEVIGNQEDRGRIEQQVKVMTGRTDFEVLAVRPVRDTEGRTRSFEVDIR